MINRLESCCTKQGGGANLPQNFFFIGPIGFSQSDRQFFIISIDYWYVLVIVNFGDDLP